MEIEDDVILEDTESFSVNLNSTDHGVQILEDKLELSILDDDCKSHLSSYFCMTSLTITLQI